MPARSKRGQVLEFLHSFQGDYQSVSDIVDATGITEKTVRKHLKSLVDEGLVCSEEDTSLTEHRSYAVTIYCAVMP